MDYLWLLLWLAVITVGAEVLVRGASSLSIRLGLSPLFVGLAVVGFGTSSPELAASVTATLDGVTDVSVGNVVGSSIMNIAAILGLTALVKPIHVRLPDIREDLAWATAAAGVTWLALPLGNEVPRWLGGVLVGLLALQLTRSYRRAKGAPAEERLLAELEVESTLELETPASRSIPRSLLQVAVGLGLLVFGAQRFVEVAIVVARGWGLSDVAIGLTVVAVGTSLPELVTSMVAAFRGNSDIAVGNVVGSNLFNLLGILGIAALVGPQRVDPQVQSLDTPVLLGVTLVLFPILARKGRIGRLEGLALVVAYAVYVVVLLGKQA